MFTRTELFAKALVRFIPGLLIISSILFISAGSLKFNNAWLFIGVLFTPVFMVIIYLIFRDPQLLLKRLSAKEKESKQRKVVLITSISILAGLIISGLDFRFKWSAVPLFMVILSALIELTGYILFILVMRQNSYASRVVEIQEKQKVIDTGLYSVVRHPMYLASILMFLFMPVLLGSFYAVIPLLIFPVQMILRIKNEEEVLEKGLEGYTEYKQKVKYRVVPYLW